MNILLIFTYNVSLKTWYKTGIIHRELLLYQALSDKNVNISFLTYDEVKDTNQLIKIPGITIIPVKNLIFSKNPLLKFIKSLLLPLKLKNTFQKIDLIKSNQLEGSWIGFFAKILYRKKLIIRGGFEWLRTYITIQYFKNKTNIIKYLYNYIRIYLLEYIAYKLADKIILTNIIDFNFVLNRFKLKKKKEKIQIIQNFIDINLFKPLKLNKKSNHVLYIGKLHLTKNVLNLVSAFKYLKNFTLDIIGDGPYMSKLKEIVKEFNLNVNFLGIIQNNELPALINQYPIFILPSMFEGNPKALLEAMSCGVACIGTNVNGINNIITHKINGYLCETNPKSISNAIITLYNDKDLMFKIEQNARKFIENHYSMDMIVVKEYFLYKELLKDNYKS